MTSTETRRRPVEMLAEDFTRALRIGAHPDIESYVAQFPAYADDIRELFPLIEALEHFRTDHSEETDPPESDSERPALMIFGDFVIMREVGRGGMGVVYEAKQCSLDRKVALKVLPSDRLPSPKHVVRFKREAKSAARLHHTNIVPVFGVGEQEGTHYSVMQLIDGQSLDKVIYRLKSLCDPDYDPEPDIDLPESGKLSATRIAEMLVSSKLESWPDILSGQPSSEIPRDHHDGIASLESPSDDDTSHTRFIQYFVQQSGIRSESIYWRNIATIAKQSARALEHAHDQGVYHRDIKPSNIIVDNDGTPWITDFGLAKVDGYHDVTASQDTVGTLRYMAPEQVRGDFDARTEIFNFGLTLYELVTLQPAYTETDQAQLIDQLVNSTPPRPRSINPNIPKDLESIILKATAPEPGNRYQTADLLANDLNRFLTGRSLRAKRSMPLTTILRWCQRNTAIARLVSLLAILLLGFVVVASFSYVRISDTLSVLQSDLENSRNAQLAAIRERVEAEDRAERSEQLVEQLRDEIKLLQERSPSEIGEADAAADIETP